MSENRALAERLKRAGQQDPAAYLDVIRMLFAAYPRHKVEETEFQTFGMLLVDIPVLELRAAIAHWTCTQKWPASVAEIRELVARRRLDNAGVARSAEAAWHEVIAKLQSSGARVPGVETEHGPPVVFDCPVTARIMTAAWWRLLRQLSGDKLQSESHAFYRAWRAEADHVREAVQCGRQLPARAEPKMLPPAPRQPDPGQLVKHLRPELEQMARRQCGLGEAAATVLALVQPQEGRNG